MGTLADIAKDFPRYELGLDHAKMAYEYWRHHKFGVDDECGSDEHAYDALNFTSRHLLTLSEIAMTTTILTQGKPTKAIMTTAVFEAVKYAFHRFAEYGKNNPEESNTRAIKFFQMIGIRNVNQG